MFYLSLPIFHVAQILVVSRSTGGMVVDAVQKRAAHFINYGLTSGHILLATHRKRPDFVRVSGDAPEPFAGVGAEETGGTETVRFTRPDPAS